MRLAKMLPLVAVAVLFGCQDQPTAPDAIAAPALAFSATSAGASAVLLGTTGSGGVPSTLVEIDPVTGATVQTIGPVGYTVNGMEFDPATGKLYGSTSVRDPNYNGLIEIDMTTGAGTPVGPSGWGGIPGANNCVSTPVTNITIDAGGQMYGWLDPCADDLVRIDKATGIATWVGASGVGTASNGLDFDNSGTLYMIQFGGVYQVNVTTGLASFTGSYSSGGGAVHHGDFHPATDLYYAIGPDPRNSPKFLEVVDISSLTVVGTVPLETDIHVLTFAALNEPPDCSAAGPSVATLWPPNHKFVPIDVLGVTDPDGDPITINIDAIHQDEPTDTFGDGQFTPDGQGVGTATAEVRAERAGTKKVPGDGRVYHISFTATDSFGGSCSSTVWVGVPHDQSGDPAVDGGALYDSTI